MGGMGNKAVVTLWLFVKLAYCEIWKRPKTFCSLAQIKKRWCSKKATSAFYWRDWKNKRECHDILSSGNELRNSWGTESLFSTSFLTSCFISIICSYSLHISFLLCFFPIHFTCTSFIISFPFLYINYSRKYCSKASTIIQNTRMTVCRCDNEHYCLIYRGHSMTNATVTHCD